MRILLIIFMLLGIAVCSPSNPLMQLEHTTKGHPLVSLTDLDVLSMKKIEAFNDPLVKTERWQIPDIGYYCSYRIEVKQSDDPTENISFPEIGLPESIYNETRDKNVTEINDSSSIPYY